MRSWGCLVILIPLTILTSIPLLFASYLYFYFSVFEPPKVIRDGDANFGLYFLIMAIIINIPAVILWYFYWSGESPSQSEGKV